MELKSLSTLAALGLFNIVRWNQKEGVDKELRGGRVEGEG